MIEISEEEVVDLLFCFCQRLQDDSLNSGFLDGTSKESLSKIREVLQGVICSFDGVISAITLGNSASTVIDMDKLALLWGTLYCYPHVMGVQADPTSLMGLIDALDPILEVEDGEETSLLSLR